MLIKSDYLNILHPPPPDLYPVPMSDHFTAVPWYLRNLLQSGWLVYQEFHPDKVDTTRNLEIYPHP